MELTQETRASTFPGSQLGRTEPRSSAALGADKGGGRVKPIGLSMEGVDMTRWTKQMLTPSVAGVPAGEGEAVQKGTLVPGDLYSFC